AEYGFAADDNAYSYAFDVAQRYQDKLDREERWGRKQPTAAKTALSDDSDPAHIEVSDDDKAMWPWEIDEIEEVKQLTADPAVASLNVWGQNRRSIEVVTPSKTAAADETELIARWESAGGRWWVSLFRSGDAVYYRAVGAGGSLGNVSDE